MVASCRGFAASILCFVVGCTVPNPSAENGSTGTGTVSGTAVGTSHGTTTMGASTVGTAGGTSTTGAPDLPPACEPDGACLPLPPQEWNGPLAVVSGPGADPPTCGGAWADEILSAGAEPVAPPATCDCSCDPPEGGTCGDVTVSRHSDNNCLLLPVETFTLAPESCDDNGGMGFPAGGRWRATPPQYTGGSCTPQTTEQVDPPEWTTVHRGCAAAPAEGTCPDGTACLPALPAGAVACIYREGDVPCPVVGDYPNRTVVYRSIQDTRGCAPCTCGDPEGTCSASVRFSLSTCTGGILLLSHPADGTCFDGPNMPAGKLSISSAVPEAACTPSPPLPEGDVTATDPVTLCCL